VSNELRKSGLFVSGGGVRSIWLRHDLQTFAKRLNALSAKVAQDGLILTEDQLRALERAREEKQAHGEIETEHPGYLGCQDTYYVGNRASAAQRAARLQTSYHIIPPDSAKSRIYLTKPPGFITLSFSEGRHDE
jgi:hypothetical protein